MSRTVLFVHQNFPAQYRHLAPALQARGDRVVAIGGPTSQPLSAIPLHRYDPRPPGGVPPFTPGRPISRPRSCGPRRWPAAWSRSRTKACGPIW